MKRLLVTVALVAACSASKSDFSADGGKIADSDGGKTADSAGKPNQAHPVCGAAPSAELGLSCSASGYGDLCTSADTKCGTLSCVIDSRDGPTDTYCAPACEQSEDCPLGYSCTDQHTQCVGIVTGKVCTRGAEVGCREVTLPGGAVPNGLFEDSAGRRYLVAGKYQETATLFLHEAGGWKALHSWIDDMDGNVRGVSSNSESTLVLLGQRVLVIASGTATEETRPVADSLIVSVDPNGAFVGLQPANAGPGYATVYRRTAPDTWEEVGPTSKKLVRAPSSLERGFIGTCSSSDAEVLCVSTDGQTYDTLQLPPGTNLTSAGTPAAGHSVSDFFIVLAGKLYHHSDGQWVREETPAGVVESTLNSKTLQLLADGTVVYGHLDDQSSATVATFVLTGGCWLPVNVAFPAAPWGSALGWIERTHEICVQPTR